ncbi:hypothetical protein [Tropicibacter oceani]|uniref:50S ribosomal protein L35 n=1 Tax=Tropicibacter oceani TaxID=3058420 RepID=A0ABY8QLW5_9RHOB|nr:hypothetical protein [Tropicibacter oceani]WGW04986.1 hypothetical protein QF118_05405 [Tropicibacter oceani]
MDPDTTLVVGMVMAVLAIPAIVSALSDGRAPRVAAIMAILAGGLMVYAINEKEGGYRIKDVPDVVYHVIGDFL